MEAPGRPLEMGQVSSRGFGSFHGIDGGFLQGISLSFKKPLANPMQRFAFVPCLLHRDFRKGFWFVTSFAHDEGPFHREGCPFHGRLV